MKKVFYIFIAFLIFTSCKESNTIYKKPSNLISKKKMVDLVVDIQLAQGAYSAKNKNKQRKIDYMPLVYEKYQIDSSDFASSMEYYISTIDDYSDIIFEAESRLEKLREEIDKKRTFEISEEKAQKEMKRKQDSIKAVKNKK
ncbi:DUF4296 domain-containing protein [Aureivirga marina]|uniref:DUF4296 domain-containing protein n=1 Tax=Aureivirga marina TaxID=1182451 RepID=UPI0018C93FB0|nr:DUF4296 domain-containing protein [Aureivirga marina]